MSTPPAPLAIIPALLGVLLFANCASTGTVGTVAPPAPAGPRVISVQQGKASYYSIRSNGGTHTASGRHLRDEAATAAHRTLPMGTKVRVTNLDNGLSEVVTITDRGPYTAGRVIDVTVGSASRLDFVRRGVVPVKVEVLEKSPEGTGRTG